MKAYSAFNYCSECPAKTREIVHSDVHTLPTLARNSQNIAIQQDGWQLINGKLYCPKHADKGAPE